MDEFAVPFRDSIDGVGFHAFAAASSDAILIVDRALNVLLWNPAAERIFGWSADDMLGAAVSKIVPPRLRAQHEAGFQRVLAGAPSALSGRPLELPTLRRDDTEFPIQMTLCLWREQRGLRVGAIIRDLSDRQAQQLEQKRLADLLHAIVEGMPVSLFVKDVEGRYVLVNQALEELTQQKRETLIGRSDHDFFPKTEADWFIKRDQLVRETSIRRDLSSRLKKIPEDLVRRLNQTLGSRPSSLLKGSLQRHLGEMR